MSVMKPSFLKVMQLSLSLPQLYSSYVVVVVYAIKDRMLSLHQFSAPCALDTFNSNTR